MGQYARELDKSVGLRGNALQRVSAIFKEVPLVIGFKNIQLRGQELIFVP